MTNRPVVLVTGLGGLIGSAMRAHLAARYDLRGLGRRPGPAGVPWTVGDIAEVRVDVHPGQVYRGKVLQIAPASGSQFALLPPDNATGNFTKVVQRIPVKIALDDPPLTSQLRPGLSAVVTVRTRN